MMPFCTQLRDREVPDVPITMSTNIVDISGVGLKQFWNLKAHMQAASQLATAHYPETLDRIFIIGAPVFFNTVWGWVKRWFDPITVSKIFILSPNEVKPTLEQFIEPRNIPKQYGGELDFKFGDLGKTDPDWEGVVEWENGYTSFPSGPMLWEDDDEGRRLVCVALGSENGEKRKVRVCTVPKTWPAEKPVANGDVENPTTATAEEAEASVSTVAAAAAAPAPAAAPLAEPQAVNAAPAQMQDEGVQTDLAVTEGETLKKLDISSGQVTDVSPSSMPVPKAAA